jgi:hypothetical protein
MFDPKQLIDPAAFPHPVSEIHLLETHISWVVLTGAYAYKLKKPVKFSFVDYSTLAKRHEYCLKELELNRRQAAELYLDVVPIFQNAGGRLRVGVPLEPDSGSDRITEYAVKMRQFSQDAILAHRLQHAALSVSAVNQLGIDIAQFHQAIEPVDSKLECVQRHHILQDALENVQLLRKKLPTNSELQPTLAKLLTWTEREFARCYSTFGQRLSDGFVRRCHGDLHLNNLIQLDGRILAFDGIEFNEEFQWIDVMSDLAFTVMDFMAAGRADFGWRMLNAYLESREDWSGMEVFRFYAVYRAMVRAKITWLDPSRHQATSMNDSDQQSDTTGLESNPWDHYLCVAESLAHPPAPKLAITCGVSGSGKSQRALKWIDRHGGLRLRSDIERRRVMLPVGQPAYSEESRERVYRHLLHLARRLLERQYPVVVDATFLKRHQRVSFRRLADQLQIPFEILVCDAPLGELERRISQRHGDPSEATNQVLHDQLRAREEIAADERVFVQPE